jgi:hypothetical protein
MVGHAYELEIRPRLVPFTGDEHEPDLRKPFFGKKTGAQRTKSFAPIAREHGLEVGALEDRSVFQMSWEHVLLDGEKEQALLLAYEEFLLLLHHLRHAVEPPFCLIGPNFRPIAAKSQVYILKNLAG